MYTLYGVDQLPAVTKLVEDQSLYNLASLYLGAPANVYNIGAHWHYPSPSNEPPNTQKWHRDRDDFILLKMFFYATDVSEVCGPHAYIPKSHSPANLPMIFDKNECIDWKIVEGKKHLFLNDQNFSKLGLKSKTKNWIGPSGFAFLEDTRGFHRALVPTKKPRLMLGITWTVGPGYR